MDDFEPDPGGVDPEYARTRIEEKIQSFEDERQREGLETVVEHLRDNGVDPGIQLHYVSAVHHLSRLGEDTRIARLRRGRSHAEGE